MSDNKNSLTNMMKQTLILTLVSAVTLVVSFGKETIVAFFFGISKVADAYTVAAEFPITLFSIISVATSTVLIPMYLKLLENDGKESAEKYVCNLISLVLAVGAVLLLIFELFSKGLIKIIAPGLEYETQQLATSLFCMLLPITMLTIIVNINTGVSNSNKNYFLPALTPNLLNIPIIIMGILLARRIGIYALVFGTVLGIVLELIYSYCIAHKYYRYRPYISIYDDNIILTLRLALPTLIGTCTEEVNKIVDRIFSSMLPSGSIAALNYASKLSSGIYSLIIASISAVAYSEFAAAAAKNDKDGLSRVFAFSNRIALLILFPIAAGGILLSNEIITIVFVRGAFVEKDVISTAPIFVAYLVGLIFSAIRVTCCRYCYSIGNTKLPTYTTILCVAMNIPLNALLSFGFGAMGLAWATTISVAISTCIIFLVICRKYADFQIRENSIFLIKLILCTAFMVFGVGFLKQLLVRSTYPLLNLLLQVLVGTAVFFSVSFVLNIEEVRTIISSLKKKINKLWI